MENKKEVKPPSSGIEKVCAPLLPAEAVERIQAKETAQLQAKAERQQKRSEAERLADVIRREQLRQIPRAQRSDDEQREFAKLEARRYRQNASKKDVLSDVPTAEKFWAANRLLLPKKTLDEYLAQQPLVEDQLYWMANGWRLPPHDPDFVSLDEGLADMETFVAEHGLISDDPLSYRHPVLQDFEPSCGVWTLQDTFDPIWRFVPAFFKDSERFNALCSESPATDIFARYGIRIGIPAYHLRLFKSRIAPHKDPFKREAHLKYDEGCWLCNFERLKGKAS